VFKKTLAHGLLLVDYVSQVMLESFGLEWFGAGSLNIRFTAPAKCGETIVIKGIIQTIEPAGDKKKVACSFTCSNKTGPVVIVDAVVLLTKGPITVS
jgi:acyl dehydratase